MVKNELQSIVEKYTGGDNELEPDYKGLLADVFAIMPLPDGFTPENLAKMTPGEISQTLIKSAEALYDKREQDFSSTYMRLLEKRVMRQIIDNLWIEHLTGMEAMREGIGLEAVAQHDPLVAYKTKGHESFENLLEEIQREVSQAIYHVNDADIDSELREITFKEWSDIVEGINLKEKILVMLRNEISETTNRYLNDKNSNKFFETISSIMPIPSNI